MAPPNMSTRGTCPVCGRKVALLADNTVARPHLDTEREPCGGYGLEGQPLPMGVPGRIRVRRSAHTGAWRVEEGDRLAYLVDSYELACVRAGQLADRARERLVLLTAEQFPPVSVLEREAGWAS